MLSIQRGCAVLVFALLITGCTASNTGNSSAGTQSAPGTPSSAGGAGAAESYCTEKSGAVVTRYPTYNTNNDSRQWVRMRGSLDFCEFTAGDKSHIVISLDTLYSDQPTLAALAYLEKPPAQPSRTPSANPSSLYCSQLGGSDLWGGENSLAGGGWVSDKSGDPFQVMTMCVFPDLSMIDSWGLTYHSNGTVRGIDLATVLRYNPSNPPNVFR